MLLKKIKLSGFKSFVDSTPVPIPSSLVGVVGPNGCGKSNIIDAVRWVMGESSAKTLRGESMTDVIFNGSSARKPLGQASVELSFDNSDFSLKGEYAKYAEIVIRREVTREGVSHYYLNNTRCRRKDIADVFLGTGLGPRSYSIIQQGTVSRLIEAKPEELRNFLEEAAGISKYKERRKETSNRIRHTRENLERLQDIRLELDKQLTHLQRQANAAEKYKVLKQEQREAKSELLARRWEEIDQQIQDDQQNIHGIETELEGKVAQLRRCETEMETSREAHTEATDAFNEVQAKFYSVGAEVSRIEQTIAHHNERKQQLEFDFNQTQSNLEELTRAASEDQEHIEQLRSAIDELAPQSESIAEQAAASQARLKEVEGQMQAWQQEWQAFSETSSNTNRTLEVEKTRVQHIEKQLDQLAERFSRMANDIEQHQNVALEEELGTIEGQLVTKGEQLQESEAELTDLDQRIETSREDIRTLKISIDELKEDFQKQTGKKVSLEALQNAALGRDKSASVDWLQAQSLADAPRLGQQLKVESGWESAVETVLGDYLQAVCTEQAVDALAEQLSTLDGACLSFVETKTLSHTPSNETLQSKIQSSIALPQLQHIYVANSLDEALARRASLQSYESVITQEGVWLGAGWLRVMRDQDHQTGILNRESELENLSSQLEAQSKNIHQNQEQLHRMETALSDLENQRETLQKSISDVRHELSQLNAKHHVKQEHIKQNQARCAQLQHDMQEIEKEKTTLHDSMSSSQEKWQSALSMAESQEKTREALLKTRDHQQEMLEDLREQARSDKEKSHTINVELQTAKTKLESVQQNLTRLEKQLTQLSERKEQLQEAVEESDAPLEGLKTQQQELLEQRVDVEKILQEARAKVTEADQSMRQAEKMRQELDGQIQGVRESLEGSRLNIQGAKVRKQTFVEQLEEMSLTVQEVLERIEEPKGTSELEELIAHIQRRIDRLGAINLTAIDEYNEKMERKQYLDEQNADLEQALETLEKAIAKIDRETREKFKETYDFVNSKFTEIFPKVFGGGSAALELTGTDLLDTGVVVTARPPGKRNSTIHLLSGGEKALTAISLVFAIFQLNPSPFCMLDEVDAPLDDSNVLRFCELVKTMSQKVQFIVITHNKVTMEMMNHLMGVTMNEPGVSRLVAVDVDQAAEMVG
ncbi:MAG: chromosome segregation protein SMC [Gammaproteobacteria bacterium]